MSALSLFDLAILRVRNTDPDTARGRDASNHLSRIAESTVASLIGQFEQVQYLDEAFATLEDEEAEEDAFDSDLAIVMRNMYEECAREAERVLLRVDRLERDGRKIKDSGTLRDCYGRTMARLSVTLDAIARSLEDVKQGRVFSLGEVRNDLYARLHR
jgi:hypothetical protein